MDFLKKRTRDESIKFISGLSGVCAELGGPLAKSLDAMVQSGNFRELVEFQFSYSDDFSIDDFCYARQIKALVEKQDFIDLGYDKIGDAVSKFRASEEKCRDTNLKFEDLSSLNWDVGGIFYIAQRKISKILGNRPCYDLLDFSFGPGASTSVKSTVSSPRVKLSSRLECSSNLALHIEEFLSEFPELARLNSTSESDTSLSVEVSVSPGKLSFVPKTCKIYRPIVVEPLLNGLGQKGIGSYIRDRLYKHGLDLRTGQTRNQKMAQKGSVDGTLATIDLSSASDSVSRGLVWSLLPYDWCCLLDSFRSECVEYEGEVLYLHKFSSMGNAFTFELETLIFYALAYATCVHLGLSVEDICVYGDDIIVPVSAYDLLKMVLEEAGFTLNSDKSFSSGPFRESCGADFLHGFDIRPVYLKDRINEATLYTFHNELLRKGEFRLAAFVHDWTYPPLRIYGPDGYGDGHLVGAWTPRRPRKLIRRGYEGGIFDTYTNKPRRFLKKLPGDYIFPSYCIYAEGPTSWWDIKEESDRFSVRGSVGYHKISIYTLKNSIF